MEKVKPPPGSAKRLGGLPGWQLSRAVRLKLRAVSFFARCCCRCWCYCYDCCCWTGVAKSAPRRLHAAFKMLGSTTLNILRRCSAAVDLSHYTAFRGLKISSLRTSADLRFHPPRSKFLNSASSSFYLTEGHEKYRSYSATCWRGVLQITLTAFDVM